MFRLSTEINYLPITIEFSVIPAEPETGILNDDIDSWEIIKINGRWMKAGKYPHKFHNKIINDKTVIDELFIEMIDYAQNYDEWR